MKLGYEDWDLNIKLGIKKFLEKDYLFHFFIMMCKIRMLLSKSIRNHIKIWKSIRIKNSSIYKINNLLSEWALWRREPSTYPLFVFFLWYLILNILPDNISLKIFLSLRSVKMFLKRFIFKKN